MTEAERLAERLEHVLRMYELPRGACVDIREAATLIRAQSARMAAAVEAERERCARIASLMQPHPDAAEFEHWSDGFQCATVAVAAAIRSQSNA